MNASTQSLSTASPTSSERQWAAGAHLSALLLALCTGWIAGAAGMLGAGIVYLVKRDDSPFAAGHAREAFNFNLSMFIYACAAVAIAVRGHRLLTAIPYLRNSPDWPSVHMLMPYLAMV